MRYEVIQQAEDWAVLCEGVEILRFTEQAAALSAIAERLRNATCPEGASVGMRYQSPGKAA